MFGKLRQVSIINGAIPPIPQKKKTHKHTKKKQTKTRVTAKGLNQGFAISNSYVESG